ncbi:MAG: hypothetical protein M0029_01085 [Actinomycetota bacterium]|nr:hypothetical protein [Actinomycetota bacterium]
MPSARRILGDQVYDDLPGGGGVRKAGRSGAGAARAGRRAGLAAAGRARL